MFTQLKNARKPIDPLWHEQPSTPTPQHILSYIGNTPMIEPCHIWQPGRPVRILAKAEWTNPSGSVKARPALRMIRQAEQDGTLRPGQTIIDATSGNTGLAYAMIGASLGYSVELITPANVGIERKRFAKVYGAAVIESDPATGIDGAIALVQKRIAAAPEKYFHPDQYSNPANWLAHYHTTGPEIWAQSGGRITHFVAGVGTGGTLMGTGRYLKERDPRIEIIAVQPAAANEKIPGLKHMPTSQIPAIFDPTFPDRTILVTGEEARCAALRLAREEGWFVGFSAGAAIFAALQIASELSQGVVVAVLPDDGSKYISSGLCEDA